MLDEICSFWTSLKSVWTFHGSFMRAEWIERFRRRGQMCLDTQVFTGPKFNRGYAHKVIFLEIMVACSSLVQNPHHHHHYLWSWKNLWPRLGLILQRLWPKVSPKRIKAASPMIFPRGYNGQRKLLRQFQQWKLLVQVWVLKIRKESEVWMNWILMRVKGKNFHIFPVGDSHFAFSSR